MRGMRRVEGERSEEGRTRSPAAGRRRRLTLAPRPWAATTKVRQGGEQVSSPVFADSDEDSELCQSWGDARSSIGSSADPLAGLRKRKGGYGSRFWPLPVDASSMATSDASSGGEAKDESSSVKKISRLSMAAQVPPIRDGAASTHAEWEVHSTTVELDGRRGRIVMHQHTIGKVDHGKALCRRRDLPHRYH